MVETLNKAEFVADKFVVVTLVPVASENDNVPPLISAALSVEIVPVVAERTVVLSAVVVTFVNVALFAIKFCNNVSPSTVRVEVTVELDAKKPAYKSKVFVADAPMLVT